MGEQPPNVRAAQHVIDMSEKLEAECRKNTRLEWRIRDLEGERVRLQARAEASEADYRGSQKRVRELEGALRKISAIQTDESIDNPQAWDQIEQEADRPAGEDGLSEVERDTLRELEQQTKAYRNGTAGGPHAVAAWLRGLADELDREGEDG